MAKIKNMKELKEIARKNGFEIPKPIVLPRAKTNPSLVRAHCLKLLQFARDNGFIISPVGYSYYVDSFFQFQSCPCAEERKSCPCPEAIPEIKTQGHCKCQLFWKDYQKYIEQKYKE